MLSLKDHKVFIKLRNVACRHNELLKLSRHYLVRVQLIMNTFRVDSYRTVPTELMVGNASTLTCVLRLMVASAELGDKRGIHTYLLKIGGVVSSHQKFAIIKIYSPKWKSHIFFLPRQGEEVCVSWSRCDGKTPTHPIERKGIRKVIASGSQPLKERGRV